METDLDIAREIAKSHVRYIERMGMHENVAIAVAEAIALGRNYPQVRQQCDARRAQGNGAFGPANRSPQL
jgi:hypothetical protein